MKVNRDVQFGLRLNKGEKEALEKIAESEGLSMNEYIRKAVFKESPYIVSMKERLTEIVDDLLFNKYDSLLDGSEEAEIKVVEMIEIESNQIVDEIIKKCI